MDDEVTAMFQVAKILEDLDEEARARVVRWAADKFGVDLGQPLEIDEATGEPIIGDVDPAKVVAAKRVRDLAGEDAPGLEVKPASSLDEPEEAPPARDPSKPSFMDTSFRMFSGKKELKKARKEKK